MFPLHLLDVVELDCNIVKHRELLEQKRCNVVQNQALIMYNPVILHWEYLANADWSGGGGNFDLILLKAKSRSFTGEVNEFLSTNTLR